MIIKVCGLKYAQNLLEVCHLDIDMVGLNFYPMSPRYCDQPLSTIHNNIQKVGVFVNATFDFIQEKTEQFQLDLIQLHGDESLDFCQQISENLKPVIKVFRIDQDFNYHQIKDYKFCKYLLFDTATKAYGGSGHKFDWSALFSHEINIPFLLAGGIGPEDYQEIQELNHLFFAGIDINSKFEISPGLKDVGMIAKFITDIR